MNKKILVCFALLFGLVLVFLIPPFDSPDEVTHFQNAWAIGHGQAFTREYWAEGKLTLPAGFGPLMSVYPARLMGLDNTEKCSWQELLSESASYVPEETTQTLEGRIFSFGYLFSALGMALASLLGSLLGINSLHSPYVQLLAGRMANWIFFVLVLRAAFQKAQPFRLTLFLLSTMPMCLFLGATLNYDAVLIPVSLYLFAALLSLYGNGLNRPSRREFGWLLLCALFLCGIKPVYVCLMPLFLLLPNDTQVSISRAEKRRSLLILLIAALGFVLASLPYLVPEGGAVGYSADQSAWLLAHPFALPGIILNTLRNDAASLAVGFWGCFGWLDVHIPKALLLLGWIILLFVAVLECCAFPFRFPKRKRLPGLFSAVLLFCVLCALLYISHTPKAEGYIIGGNYTAGFQGRYLIPCFLPFLLTFANSSLIRKKPGLVPILKEKALLISAVWGVCCCLITAVTLLARYWI